MPTRSCCNDPSRCLPDRLSMTVITERRDGCSNRRFLARTRRFRPSGHRSPITDRLGDQLNPAHLLEYRTRSAPWKLRPPPIGKLAAPGRGAAVATPPWWVMRSTRVVRDGREPSWSQSYGFQADGPVRKWCSMRLTMASGGTDVSELPSR